MPVLDASRAATDAAVDDDDVAAGAHGRQWRSCLPFCFWRGSSRGTASGAAPGRKRRRRRRGLRFKLRAPWFFTVLQRIGKKKDEGGGETKGRNSKRRGGRLLLLLTTSLQPKKALASVVSGDSSLLPAKVSSFGDANVAKKQNRSKPRPKADGATPSGTRQPQASTAAASARESTAPARPVTSQPCRKQPTDEPPAVAGRIWRAPSRRHSLRPDIAERPAGTGGLWTAATTLGVIVLFGRVTAVVFLCSCLYGARFVRARLASAKATSSGVAGGSSGSRRLGDPVGVGAEKAVDMCSPEECKKKVVMAGLLDRTGKRPSSRFGR